MFLSCRVIWVLSQLWRIFLTLIMRLLKKQVDDFLIYENVELSILVAIRMEDQKKIKKYWKSKDKSAVEATISGFPFIQTEEQESLKIEFSKKQEYEIVNLKKFN